MLDVILWRDTVLLGKGARPWACYVGLCSTVDFLDNWVGGLVQNNREMRNDLFIFLSSNIVAKILLLRLINECSDSNSDFYIYNVIFLSTGLSSQKH
jgi:hypothetical protein